MAINRIAKSIFSKNIATLLNRRVDGISEVIGLTTRSYSNETGFWSSIVAGSGDARSGSHSKILANNCLYELQCELFLLGFLFIFVFIVFLN